MKPIILLALILTLSTPVLVRPQSSSSDFFKRGLERYKAEDWPASIEAFTKVIELSPNNLEAYFNRGLARAHNRDLNGAVDDFTKVINTDPKASRALLSRAEVLYNRDSNEGSDLIAAIEDLTKVIELQPGLDVAYEIRARAYSRARKFDEAIADHTKALEISPSASEIYYYRAEDFTNKKDFDAAISDYDKYIAAVPGDSAGYFKRAILRFKKKDFKNALLDFTKSIELDTSESNGYYLRARTRLLLNDNEGAYADAAKYVELEGGDYSHADIVLIGYLALKRSNKPDEAKAFLAAALKGLGSDSNRAIFVRYLMGEVTEEQLLKETRLRFKTHLYVGMYLASAGQGQAALEHLRFVSKSEEDAYEFVRYLSDAEIARIEGNPNSKSTTPKPTTTKAAPAKGRIRH
jgi:tetratricopeptide (TPR) repeat protein